MIKTRNFIALCIFLMSGHNLFAVANLASVDDPFFTGPEANQWHDAKGPIFKNQFNEPADNLSYADYVYVGTHNSHVYYGFFNTVYQQAHSIIHQLNFGVRGLMLDTYYWDLGGPAKIRPATSPTTGHPTQVVLSHNVPGFVAFTQKGHNSYQSLKYEMRRIVEWMKENPRAIVTILLEDYVHPAIQAGEIKQVMLEAKYNPLFYPSDLGTKKWSEINLGWMRNNNKRLVIFTQKAEGTDVTFQQMKYNFENQYSILDNDGTNKALCQQRGDSKTIHTVRVDKKLTDYKDTGKPWPQDRELAVFNNFSGLAVTHASNNIRGAMSEATVKKLVALCKGRHFNGYYGDRVIDTVNSLRHSRIRTIFDYVNSVNSARSKAK